MKKCLILMVALVAIAFSACATPQDNPNNTPKQTNILVAYFSWGGTTKKVAEEIVTHTGADLFRIEPVQAYPTEYKPCTEVAKKERDENARPAIKGKIENIDKYDVIFIGCPVWWHTAPMIISTFAESYNLRGKTIVPFCTYAETYRDETLAKIVELTPYTRHLKGFGSTGSTSEVKAWLEEIDILKTPAEKEMIDLSRQKWQWMAEKNADRLAELFHDEAQFVHMGGYWGKEQELNTIRSGGIWYKEAEIHSEEVKFTENTAVVYSRIHLNAVVGGNEVRNPFIVSEVYVKEGGKWKLSVLAFTKTMGE